MLSFMNLGLVNLMTVAAAQSSYSLVLLLAIGIGFVAAVTIGSIAWYNSKRPLGWKDKERPDFIPEIKPEEML